jgi:hypothetical protein
MTTNTQNINGKNLLLKNNSNFTNNIFSSSSMTSNLSIVLPPTLGNSNTFLQTNGSGITSWAVGYSTNSGPTGATGQFGANGVTGSTGATGPTGVSPMTNVHIYEATNATITSAAVNAKLPISQYEYSSPGITWSTDTATVLYNGVYSIYFYFRPTAGTVGAYGVSINGASPQAYHRVGVLHANGGIDGGLEIIVSLSANDTISVLNLDTIKTYAAFSTGLSCFLNIVRITR